jgi:DNA-nicking Smr family endonuclease
MKKNSLLDLHGVRHSDVRKLVIDFVENHWNSNVCGEIVTGHSIQMRNLVTEVLDEYSLEYKANGPITRVEFE